MNGKEAIRNEGEFLDKKGRMAKSFVVMKKFHGYHSSATDDWKFKGNGWSVFSIKLKKWFFILTIFMLSSTNNKGWDNEL